MMKLEARSVTIACALATVTLFGCATVAPRELVEAREAYRLAAAGPAITLAPSQLDTARKALERAEKEFAERPKELETRDYAYIAHRQALLAGVKATTEQSSRQKVSADKQLATGMKQSLARSEDKNRAYRDELEDSQDELEDLKEELEDLKDELDIEKKARVAAENQADDLIAKLEKIATVKRQEDRIVISLSGGILFASGKSTLLASAPATLDRVAEALLAINDPQTITIEGHTDSVGSDDTNQALSFSRADGVRTYLVSRGITADMSAIGLGETRPIEDNSTSEGRANNRRVEIIVSPNP